MRRSPNRRPRGTRTSAAGHASTARLPTLAAIAADPQTRWTPVTVAHWYGAGARTVEVVPDTAVWYHTGRPAPRHAGVGPDP